MQQKYSLAFRVGTQSRPWYTTASSAAAAWIHCWHLKEHRASTIKVTVAMDALFIRAQWLLDIFNVALVRLFNVHGKHTIGESCASVLYASWFLHCSLLNIQLWTFLDWAHHDFFACVPAHQCPLGEPRSM